MPFRTVEEIISWRPHECEGRLYDLSHLNAHHAEYVEIRKDGVKRNYRFIVTYSMHCFTTGKYNHKKVNANELYSSPKETRLFHNGRYALSKNLREIVESLGSVGITCFHTGHGSFATINISDIEYLIVFTLYREKKKLRMHIVSAYSLDQPYGRFKKINFFTIAYNTLQNKKILQPK